MIEIITDYAGKQKTRPLYEQAFDDPADFVDFYYAEKCRDNVIVADVEGDRVLSMCHLNPYTWIVRGREIISYYLVAVATDREFRHRGLMTGVLEASFDYMRGEHIPFCYLLPVDTDIYFWMGFRTVCDYQGSDNSSYEDICRFYDMYCKWDERYIDFMNREKELDEAGTGEVLPDHSVMMAKVLSLSDFSEMAGTQILSEESGIEWLLSQRIFFREDV